MIQLSRHKFPIWAYYRPPGESQAQVAQLMCDAQRCIDVAYTSNLKGLVLLGDFKDKCQYFDSNYKGRQLANKVFDLSRMNNLASPVNTQAWQGHQDIGPSFGVNNG